MPPREAKGRYLTREYMADAAFHRELTAAQREFYLLLALFTDDSGWLEWTPDDLMYSIYRFSDSRSADWDDGVEALVRTKRLRVLKCGHAEMPKVAKRPRPGEHEHRVRDLHESSCSRLKTTKPNSLPNLTKPNQTIPHPAGARARTRGGAPTPIGAEVGDLKRRVGWKG